MLLVERMEVPSLCIRCSESNSPVVFLGVFIFHNLTVFEVDILLLVGILDSCNFYVKVSSFRVGVRCGFPLEFKMGPGVSSFFHGLQHILSLDGVFQACPFFPLVL